MLLEHMMIFMGDTTHHSKVGGFLRRGFTGGTLIALHAQCNYLGVWPY